MLQKAGQEVSAVDALSLSWSMDKFLKEVENLKPDFVIIETCTPSINQDLKTSGMIKERLPNTKIALCGPHATTFPNEILKENEQIDFIFLGEYEYTARETVLALENKSDLKNVLGIAFREGKTVIVNSRRPLIDLNDLPFPARELFDMGSYYEPFAKQPSIQLVASRGCTFGCLYCLWPPVMYGGRNYRFRKPEGIISEIEHIVKTYNPRQLYFDDDTFNLVPQKVFDFCKAYKESGINKEWSAMCSAIPATKEMLVAMRDAGCEALKFGVESGSPEILKNVGRSVQNLDHVKDVFRWCKELGIRTLGTFVLGLPGETKQTIQQTFKYFLELAPTAYQVSVATPLPGTPFYEMMKKSGFLLAKSWEDYGNSHYIYKTPMIRTKDLTAEELKKYSEYFNTTLYLKNLGRMIISDPKFAMNRIKNLVEQEGVKKTIKKVLSRGVGVARASVSK